jgi:hypothetical protein
MDDRSFLLEGHINLRLYEAESGAHTITIRGIIIIGIAIIVRITEIGSIM